MSKQPDLGTFKVNPHSRLMGLSASATLAINERSARLAAEGKKVFKFGLGQSPFPVPRSVVEALRNNAHQKDYLPVKGLLPLRQMVASWLSRRSGLRFDAEHILIAPGSKELLFLIQMAVDGVLLLPSPSWVSYFPQSKMAGNDAYWIDTTEEDDWLLTAAALRDACHCPELAGKNKILLLNYPNNPTGTTFTASQLRALAAVAKEEEILIVSDEIYGEVHHLNAHHSIAEYYPEGSIVTTGLSKWCGAGGWRLGLAAFPANLENLVDALATMASETYTSASAPIQYASISAFEDNPAIDEYLKRSREVLAFIQDYIREAMLNSRVSIPKGTGGFYLFANFEQLRGSLAKLGIQTGPELCEELLEKTGIATLPGNAFGRPDSELTLRLSYVDFDGENALKNIEAIRENPGIAAGLICPRIEEAMNCFADWAVSLP